ncbi:MAG TPA: hypothetical protein VGF07_12435 [Stellaceae bacterium]
MVLLADDFPDDLVFFFAECRVDLCVACFAVLGAVAGAALSVGAAAPGETGAAGAGEVGACVAWARAPLGMALTAIKDSSAIAEISAFMEGSPQNDSRNVCFSRNRKEWRRPLPSHRLRSGIAG